MSQQADFPGSMHIRSPLARAMHQRLIEDNAVLDTTEWYSFRIRLLSEDMAAKFVQFSDDDETREFLENCKEKSDQLFTQLFHSVVKCIFSWAMNKTSINGLLQRGSMFVFSQAQFQQLLGINADWTAESLLDLGAGDGAVTRQMAQHFRSVYVTEVSSTMLWRLQEQGYSVLGIDDWAVTSQTDSADRRQYDVISCLNLLDRCERPLILLQQIRASLVPTTGRLVLAVVLPFSSYVETASDHHPNQHLHVSGEKFEEQLSSLVRDVLVPVGFEVERFTKLPYLSEGDLYHSYYVLYDAVFVLRPVFS